MKIKTHNNQPLILCPPCLMHTPHWTKIHLVQNEWIYFRKKCQFCGKEEQFTEMKLEDWNNLKEEDPI